MPIKPTEMERIILADGWIFKTKPDHIGIIFILQSPESNYSFHKGKELNKITENSIRKQAGIK